MKEHVLMRYVYDGKDVANFRNEINDEWLADGWQVKSVSVGEGGDLSLIVFVLQKDEELLNSNQDIKEIDEDAIPRSNQDVKEIDEDDIPQIEYPKSFISEFDSYGFRNTKCAVTDIKIVQKSSQIIMNFNAKKIYDKKGESSNEEIRFNYKVKDFSGVVVSKGYWVEHNIFIGDVVKGCVSIKDIPASGYIFEFSDFKDM